MDPFIANDRGGQNNCADAEAELPNERLSWSQSHHSEMAHIGAAGKAGAKEGGGLRYPSNGKTIYHRPLNRSKTSELSKASFAYLFSEMVTYAQRRVTGIQDLEKRYVFSVFRRLS